MTTRRLPLFPLPLVLFPGVPLPLHIFEPRYRIMLADCLEGDREFGIAFRPDGVAERDLPSGHIGCVAHIESTELLPDGRSNVIVRGTERFMLDRYLDSARPYFMAEASEYDDADEPPLTLEPSAERVRELFKRVGTAARTLTDDPDALPALPENPALLAFAVGALIEMDPAARQRLLASRSPSGRLRDIEMLLSPAVDSLERRATVHVRAKSNGHGPHPGA
ncbi:MAG TPA: LON peptidase substrate-binding domain-containing protein [Gemmatimonadaceae bacterium]|nr:LON peptidase substrate-binding domain-containing protein [Gemmatimonadaceae bacterium]